MATPTACLRALQDAADRLDESPTKQQYEGLGLTPSASTIIRHFDGWNAAKREAGLATNPSRGPRVGPKPDDVAVSDDEWAALSQDQRWHYRNREHNTQRTLDRRDRLRAAVYEYKRDHRRCQRCGEPEPACLEFHHRDPAEKKRTVSELISYGHALETVRAEIEKCDVLCANCHRNEHYEVPDAVTPAGERGEALLDHD
jgi:hypothetical protein